MSKRIDGSLSEEQPWLADLDGEDLPRFIESNSRAICVVAGPGAGKSTGIGRRIQRLITRREVEPDRVFVGTFTRAIARELRKAAGDKLRVSTLHSLALSLLRAHPAALGTRKLRFLLQYEEDSMLQDVGHSLGLGNEQRDRRRSLKRMQAEISQRRELSDAQFAGAVETWLRLRGGMLIGEVVPLAIKALEARDIPQGQFDQLVIDEYQDLTAAEQVMVELLFSGKGSLVVLGDDDQSIYRFRYNHPRGLAEFIERWKDQGLETIGFPDNRRSGKEIVGLANMMMAEAGSKKAPMNPARPEAGTVRVVDWPKLEDELVGIAKFMSKRLDSFLVLVPRRFIGHRLQRLIGTDARTDFHQEPLFRTLVQERFALASLLPDTDDPVAIRAWLGFEGDSFTQSTHRNRAACASIPYVGQRAAHLCDAIAAGQVVPKGIGAADIGRRAARWQALVKSAPGEIRDLIAYLFDPDLADALENDDARAEARAALSDLRDAAHAMVDEGKTDIATIVDTLRYRIATRTGLVELGRDARVRIMTLYSAKGLEAEIVAVVGVADQIIPGIPDDDPTEANEEREEQRRLLYVAISRARNGLLISWSRTAAYVDAANNYIRIDSTFTDEAREKRVRLSKSALLPGSLAAPTPGAAWLRSFGM